MLIFNFIISASDSRAWQVHDLPGAVGDTCGVFSVQAPCLFVLREGGKINLHLSESSQKGVPRNFELLPAADITFHTSKGMWSVKAFFLLLIRRKQLVAAGGGSETDQVNHFLCSPGQNKSVGLEVFLLVSLKKKQKKNMNLRAAVHLCVHAFFAQNAQLPSRDLANETGVMQQEWSRRRQHEWKPNRVRRRLQGLIWRVAAAGRRGGGRRVERGEGKKSRGDRRK